MTLIDTIPLMTSEDYKNRFRAEYWQLKIRVEKLKTMLEKCHAGTLNFTPACSLGLLLEQRIYMEHYLTLLERRAGIEEISLEG